MGRLAELMQARVQLASQGMPSPDLVLGNLLAEWGGVPYAELSVVLVHLRHLAMLHQTHHWTAMGDPFYGDHLLFERMYNKSVEEIDAVAEKAVGMGNERNVNMALQATQLARLTNAYGATGSVPQARELALRSLQAETSFVTVVDAMCNSMKDQGTCTQGIENMLQGIADSHESHFYLLKRRLSNAAMGM
jgi:DNA-binding ferritin-like protein